MLVGSEARRRAHRTEEPLLKVCHSLLPTGRGTRGAPESPSCLVPMEMYSFCHSASPGAGLPHCNTTPQSNSQERITS